jgi:allantoinase
VGEDDCWQGWGGIGGNQTMLPVLLTEGVHRHGLSLPALVRMTCSNPAKLFGLYPQKGHLAPGADADLTIVDLNKKWTLQRDQLLCKNKETPFIGHEFTGSVERTLLRGKTIYQDGKVTVEPGYGRFLRRGEWSLENWRTG